jgi:hypothetical protein
LSAGQKDTGTCAHRVVRGKRSVDVAAGMLA